MSATPSTRRHTIYSSINTSSTTDARRSVRLSTKSPRKTSLSSNQSNLHRTISGGVANNHSPKLNVRKQTAVSTDAHNTSASSITYSTITSNDNVDIHHDDNNSSCRNLLPSDQSDDDEMLLDNNILVKQTLIRIATRSEVLSYFSIENNGYKCKLCNKVSLIFLKFSYTYMITIFYNYRRKTTDSKSLINIMRLK
jgi:hypothetical protein